MPFMTKFIHVLTICVYMGLLNAIICLSYYYKLFYSKQGETEQNCESFSH